MQITADVDRCQGHGRCSLLAPDVFDVNDEGKVLLLIADVDEALVPDVLEAITSCPEGALARM
ncbi:hypothetical protein GCM10023350_42850 [Nocardioides endophyticus]|uniref:Ferredoxin n=1 Tax=Nocardioides endophyticus TaxID=1353775 RepID=A0ABP8ZCF4_9ACTN